MKWFAFCVISLAVIFIAGSVFAQVKFNPSQCAQLNQLRALQPGTLPAMQQALREAAGCDKPLEVVNPDKRCYNVDYYIDHDDFCRNQFVSLNIQAEKARKWADGAKTDEAMRFADEKEKVAEEYNELRRKVNQEIKRREDKKRQEDLEYFEKTSKQYDEGKQLLKQVKVGMHDTDLLILQLRADISPHINKTTTKYGVHEQWVFKDYDHFPLKILYFEDGVLTTIQE